MHLPRPRLFPAVEGTPLVACRGRVMISHGEGKTSAPSPSEGSLSLRWLIAAIGFSVAGVLLLAWLILLPFSMAQSALIGLALLSLIIFSVLAFIASFLIFRAPARAAKLFQIVAIAVFLTAALPVVSGSVEKVESQVMLMAMAAVPGGVYFLADREAERRL
jgi:predicted neutral ceramidase superfamily lipid hydrolase